MGPGPAMGYYNVPTHPYGMHADPTGAMRFSIAPGMPPDPRIAMSGGRHKKVPVHQDNSPNLKPYIARMLTIEFCGVEQEIKRRTKTGCLTCRKRRIKVRYLSHTFFLGCTCQCLQRRVDVVLGARGRWGKRNNGWSGKQARRRDTQEEKKRVWLQYSNCKPLGRVEFMLFACNRLWAVQSLDSELLRSEQA